ncbi:MAG: 6-hydroxymethylpterin diphosphokinase MptE-like protein [Dehalococcoidia bacterium]
MRRSRLLVRSAYHQAIPLTLRRRVHASIRRRQRQRAYSLDENLRSMPQRLRGLKDKYRGQRCFIMGNGPSLNQMDLELFRREYVWASNKCYLLFDRISWRPAFYVAVDTRVVPDIAAPIDNLVRSLPETMSFFPAKFREQGVLRSHPNVYWYRQVPDDETNLPQSMFTWDASEGVSAVTTVTIAALQLAVYLGFNPIYLIGCDTSYSSRPNTRIEGTNPDELTADRDDDLDHFDARYFGAGCKFHEPHVERMVFHYEQAKRACEALSTSVFNATVGGKLDVFPRIDYRELF